jgi:Protein of unknown function (DUF3667)
MSESVNHCLNCNTPLQGQFCYACGQKVVEPNDRTLKHFIFQFFGAAFFLENNFLKNIWILFAKPGQLTIDIIEGRRKRWMPPFSLFLLINLFYFWYTPFSDFNQTLYEQTHFSPYKDFTNVMVENKLAAEKIKFDTYAEIYNKKSSVYANSLIILHIPIMAAFLLLLFYRNKYFYADHFVFALHLLGFLLLVGLSVGLVVGIDKYLFTFLNPLLTNTIQFLYLGGILFYTWKAISKVYKRKWWVTSIYLPLVLAVFMFTHILYRLLLFLIVYTIT